MTHPRLVGNRYELRELIGYGGMAEVHRGKDARLGRDVAIKVLRADLARDQTFLNRFRREAQSAAGLNHPAIVAVYDTGEDGGADGALPYIVMEFVEGRTLRDVLKAEGKLPVRRAMEIVAEICSALDFSHRNGIVHRDIKPANVMITDTGAVKVMDFGIARALSDDAATVTATAAVIGTAQYLSPEQARGESVDARSDVYSTGCLLYELVTGQPPFTGDSPVAVAYQHVRETAAVPSSLNPEIPSALDSIVMKALAKNPLNRYQTAGDMRSDLMRALADRPVEAEAFLTDADRTQIIARSNVGARPPIVPGGGVPVPDEDDGGNRRRGAIIWALVVVAMLLVIGGAAYAIVALGKSDKPKTVAVPSLIGSTPAAANSALVNAGFQPPSGTPLTASVCGVNPQTQPQTNVTEGNVCTQEFAPNTKQRKGTIISYTVFKKPSVTLISVVGNTLSDAQNKLQALGLKTTTTLVNNPAPPNQVVDQNPKAGTAVPPGSSVTLSVSTGKVAIPDEKGKSFVAAQNDLNQQGWANVNQSFLTVHTPTQAGLVQSSSPSAGSAFSQDTPITLVVGNYVPLQPTCTTPPPSSSHPASNSASNTGSASNSASTTPGAPTTSASTSTSSGGLPACTS